MEERDPLSDPELIDTPSSSEVACTSLPQVFVAISDAHRSFCKACSLAKLQGKPSFAVDNTENISFLHRIQGEFVDLLNLNANLLNILWF